VRRQGLLQNRIGVPQVATARARFVSYVINIYKWEDFKTKTALNILCSRLPTEQPPPRNDMMRTSADCNHEQPITYVKVTGRQKEMVNGIWQTYNTDIP